ncbi:MAG: peptidase domain-containing ABC transporter [Bacteroidota bacterium]
MKFTFFSQLEMTDCGAACLQMVLNHYGTRYSLQEVRSKCNITRSGVTFRDIKTGADELGLDSLVGKLAFEQLEDMPLPCILHWNQEHFVVLYDIKKKSSGNVYKVADPGFGKISLSSEELQRQWKGNNQEGVAMFFEPQDRFDEIQPEQRPINPIRKSWQFIEPHLRDQGKKVAAISTLLLLSAGISWYFPILLTKLIDEGVNPRNVNIVIAVLGMQFALFFGQLVVEWARSLISAHFSTALSVSIITEFIKKLIKLPIRFFDTRLYTDILQKIDDHSHIEGFITHMFLQFVFSLVSFIFLSSLLAYYNFMLFAITLVLSVGSVSWIGLFLNQRKKLDYERFRIRSDNRNVLYETILGMPEVKINNAQEERFDTIRSFQYKLFGLNVKATNLFQLQQIGVQSISQLNNIVVTFLCAYWVIYEQMTLGVMVSVGYIIGQMSNPLDSFVSFFRSAQDAKIAMNRLDEIQQKEDETSADDLMPPEEIFHGIHVNNLSFKYDGTQNLFALKDIDFLIPAGKITALVGSSGSGKSTLMKLLLNFYDPQEGSVQIDQFNLKDLNADAWRSKCGVVLQDGFIFSGTIAENIALADKDPDPAKLRQAAQIACIYSYIESLPLGFNTKIGQTGVEISGGQKQRILIARAVYNNPGIIFLDEATNALDATNEKMIMDNLNDFFEGKTVLVIAHRLSTVKNADQIIVLENGQLSEVGNHESLTEERGKYFELVKNQLELGN